MPEVMYYDEFSILFLLNLITHSFALPTSVPGCSCVFNKGLIFFYYFVALVC